MRETVERLIVEERVDTFLFGSRSNFDELCYIVVTGLKEKYLHIQRIAYLRKHETACLVGAGVKMKQQIKQLTGRDVYVPEYEDIKRSDRVDSAGRASYVECNCLMIKDCNFVVVHLAEERNGGKSGTRLAYKYSLRQKKSMITV